MSTKTKTIFVCQECGTNSLRWVGKCPNCESWNSFVEEQSAAHPEAQKLRLQMAASAQSPVLLKDVDIRRERRFLTGIGEFDRVMGGGVVPGSVTLIGGDPGIGKSTIVIQGGYGLARQGLKVLYVSGEESVRQAKLRADRVAKDFDGADLFIVNAIDVQEIVDHIHTLNPQVVVIDSIQVVHLAELSSSPGSVAQVRESAAVFTQLAKAKGIALFLVGHVTKEGMLAGPRVLEHMVDTVLYFEGERYSSYRVLRANKNRFGSTNEIGVFEMTAAGLQEVLNPSEIFLSERPQDSSGSVVVPVLEGTRPFLVEIQGLVSRSAFGMVRQKAQGFDSNRLALLVAVLEKRLGLNLGDKDIFLNVVGGVKVMDPAADLAVTLAVASALLDKPVPHDLAVLGEVGLSAEVRSVSQVEVRVNEAQKLGFTRCIMPKNNLKGKADYKPKGIKLIPVTNVREALDKM